MTGFPVPIADALDLITRTREGDERAFGRAAGVVVANIPDRLHTGIRVHEPKGVLVVAGTPQTLQVVRSVLDQYDTQCIAKDPAPPR